MVKIDLVRRPSLHNPRSFLEYIFFTDIQVEQAAKILNILKDSKHPIPESQWADFVYSSRGLYVKVMKRLRDLGLVEKELGNYSLSLSFTTSLEKLANYWRDVVDSDAKQITF